MGFEPVTVLPPPDIRFTGVEPDCGVTNVVRGIFALLGCSAAPFEAFIEPGMCVPVEIRTESVKVESARSFFKSLDTAILII